MATATLAPFEVIGTTVYDASTDTMLATRPLVTLPPQSDKDWLAEWTIEFDDRYFPAVRRVPVFPGGIRMDGWISIAEIMSHESLDVITDPYADETPKDAWQRVMTRKRDDYSYSEIMTDIAKGWGLTHPVGWRKGLGLGNGHHRVTAAFDSGYTHVPVVFDAWAGTT